MYIFINNKYSKVYWNIITRAKMRVNTKYVEKHHIIPKCLGGTNKKSNIVELTPKEHYLCHRLLTKMTNGDDKKKMVYAWWAMTVHTSRYTNGNRYVVTGKRYETARTEYRKLVIGKPKSKEHREKLGKYERTPEIRKAISDSRKAQIGKQHRTDETKKKMSKWQKGIPKPIGSCQYCGKTMSLMNLSRWHGENCKNKGA